MGSSENKSGSGLSSKLDGLALFSAPLLLGPEYQDGLAKSFTGLGEVLMATGRPKEAGEGPRRRGAESEPGVEHCDKYATVGFRRLGAATPDSARCCRGTKLPGTPYPFDCRATLWIGMIAGTGEEPNCFREGRPRLCRCYPFTCPALGPFGLGRPCPTTFRFAAIIKASASSTPISLTPLRYS